MPRSLDEFLLTPDSVGVRLMDSSGERCYSLAALKARAGRMLAPAGLPVDFRVGQLPEDTGIASPVGDRYNAGCAVIVGAYPIFSEGEAPTIEVEILQREAAG